MAQPPFEILSVPTWLRVLTWSETVVKQWAEVNLVQNTVYLLTRTETEAQRLPWVRGWAEAGLTFFWENYFKKVWITGCRPGKILATHILLSLNNSGLNC